MSIIVAAGRPPLPPSDFEVKKRQYYKAALQTEMALLYDKIPQKKLRYIEAQRRAYSETQSLVEQAE
ncbi:hypothetical protein LJB81_04485, partial [Desulfovibrio sp. OttesenSCG-928-M14]|nr:hypothetical protein [Desulfovibrio sp. OttesenSCG-928-M14]